MALELVTIPCLQDNYAYLIHDAATGATALVDAPDHAPILAALTSRGWGLSDILITHHHPDHVQGVGALRDAFPDARVAGPAAEEARLPALDRALRDGESVEIGRETGRVIAVPGHTLGHIAYHFPGSHLAFTADSLMALGCGRLFEGTAAQMWESLSKLASLPPETRICSGHEYTQSNARFAQTIEPENPALISRVQEIETLRKAGTPTVPSLLSLELATNPFLRAAEPNVQANLGMIGAKPEAVFAEIRGRKDKF